MKLEPIKFDEERTGVRVVAMCAPGRLEPLRLRERGSDLQHPLECRLVYVGFEVVEERFQLSVQRYSNGMFQPSHAPAPCKFAAREASVPAGPQLIAAGLATTGPLSRALFFEGEVEEQALVGRIRGKGCVVITGCGHPGLDVLVAMARRLIPGQMHAVIGGLTFPAHGVALAGGWHRAATAHGHREAALVADLRR